MGQDGPGPAHGEQEMGEVTIPNIQWDFLTCRIPKSSVLIRKWLKLSNDLDDSRYPEFRKPPYGFV